MNFIKKLGYSTLGLLHGNKGVERNINGFKVRFPAQWSRFYEPDYEKENYEFLRRTVKPGMHIIDIGAHFGLFSVASSQLGGPASKIISFEPAAGTYGVLSETLKLNHCNNVTAINGAVSDKEGTSVFYVSKTGGCNANSLVKNKSNSEGSGDEVNLYTIDHIVHQYALTPGLIKIDAEGSELDVLKGGRETFRLHRPTLILGLHPPFIEQKGDSLEMIWDLLKEAQYQVYENEKLIDKYTFCNRRDETLFDVHCL